MKAIILAGGKGTRLKPYTTVFPKPLVPIGDMPVLDIVVRQLYIYGFNDIVISVGYLSELIQAYFLNSSKDEWPNISFAKEREPLGTAGALSLIDDLDDTFLVMNGDILTTLDYAAFFKSHKESGTVLSIAMQQKEVNINLGVIQVDDNNQLINYLEKPKEVFWASMGIYCYEPHALSYIEPNVYLDFPTLVMRLKDNKEKINCYISNEYWMDIGRQEDYIKAVENFNKMGPDVFLKNQK